MAGISEDELFLLSLPAFEEEILLAGLPNVHSKNVTRYVRTPEGAEFYGLPVGSIIKPDLLDKKHNQAALLGIAPPKGALSDEVGAAVDHEYTLPKIKVSKSSLKGPVKFHVGESDYEAPKGSKIIKPAGLEGMVYVATPDGKVYAYNAQGQVELPGTAAKALSIAFGKDLDPDKFEAVEPDSESPSFDTSALPSGHILNDKRGAPAFKKNDDGSFSHVDLPGVSMDAKDIDPLVSSGHLTPAEGATTDALESGFENSEAQNFASMTPEEVTSALDGMEDGAHVYWDGADGPTGATLQDGDWVLDDDGSPISSATLSLIKSSLKNGPTPEPDPADENAPDEAPAEPETPPEPEPVLPAVDKTQAIPAAPEPSADENVLPDGVPAGSIQPKTLYSIPKTATITVVEDGAVYHMKPNSDGNSWKDDLPGVEQNWSEEAMSGLINQGLVYYTPKVEEPEAPAPEKFAGDAQDLANDPNMDLLTVKDLANLPNGSPFSVVWDDGEVETFTKNGSKATSLDEPDGHKPDLDIFNEHAAKGNVFGPKENSTWDATQENAYESEPDFPDLPWVQSATLGSQIVVDGADGHLWTWTKTDEVDNSWRGESDTGEVALNSGEGLAEMAAVFGSVDKYARSDEGLNISPKFVSHAKGKPTYQETVEAPVGSSVYFTQTEDDGIPDPTKNAWIKVAPNLWRTPAARLRTNDDLANAMAGESASIFHWDDGASHADVAAPLPAVGEKINTTAKINALADGTALALVKSNGQTSFYTKVDGDKFLLPNGTILPTNQFATSIGMGKFTVAENPGQPSSENIVNIQFEVGGHAYSVPEVTQAIEALQAHPSFQVSYGLNALPESNSLAQMSSGELKNLQEEAKLAFPDLTAKPAVVAYLKQKAGIVDTKEKFGKDIHFGDHLSPKDTNTGKTGGTFAQSEVIEAIGILKAYNGKLFKNELNKKGNALGILSPNDLVGFDKDKQVTKQKFIELLTSKIVTTGGPPDSQTFEKISEEQVKAAVAGDSVIWHGKSGHTSTWTKQSSGWWKGDQGTTFTQDYVEGQAHFGSLEEGKTSDAPKPAAVPDVDLLSGDEIPSGTISFPTAGEGASQTDKDLLSVYDKVPTATIDEIKNAPIGSQLVDYHNTFAISEYEKISDVEWKHTAFGTTMGQNLFASAAVDGKIKIFFEPGQDAPDLATSLGDADGTTSALSTWNNPLTPKGLANVPQDQVVVFWNTKRTKAVFAKKNADGEWIRVTSTEKVTNANMLADLGLAYQVPTADEISGIPVGTTVYARLDGGQVLYKASADQWFDYTGYVYSDSFIKNLNSKDQIAIKEPGTQAILDQNASLEEQVKQLTPGARLKILNKQGVPILHDAVSNGTAGLKYVPLDGQGSGTVTYTDAHMPHLIASGSVTIEKQGPPVSDQNTVLFTDGFDLGTSVTGDNIDNLPIGAVIGMKGDNPFADANKIEYTRVNANQWVRSKGPFQGKVVNQVQLKEHIAASTDIDAWKISGFGPLQSPASIEINWDVMSPDFDAMPDFTVIKAEQDGIGTQMWTKVPGNTKKTWMNENGAFTVDAPNIFKKGGNYDKLTVVNLPNLSTATPDALSHKQFDDNDLSVEALSQLPEGHLISIVDPDDGKTYWARATLLSGNTKTYWLVYDPETGKQRTTGSYNLGSPTIVAGYQPVAHVDLGPVQSDHGIAPGRWTSQGNASLYVREDGTGVYVSASGVVKPLTADQVKKNYDAGMNRYLGPADAPSVTEVPITHPKDLKSLKDGIYYAGPPHVAKTAVYEIKDGKITYRKGSLVSMKIGSTTYKPNSKVTQEWLDHAPIGSAFDQGTSSSGPKFIYKTASGWKSDDEKIDIEAVLKNVGSYYYGTNYKITSNGFNAPVDVKPEAMNTQFLKGELLDGFGNSVVPQGYNGPVYVFGKQNSLSTIQKASEALDGESGNINSLLSSSGFAYSPAPVFAYVKQVTGSDWNSLTAVERQKALQKALDGVLAGLDTEPPKGEGSATLQWDTLGHAKMPNFGVLEPGKSLTKGQQGTFISNLNKHYDGVIGQFSSSMDGYARDSWIAAWSKGDFKTMYDVEVKAAAEKGKVLVDGFKHPGYEGNEDTHQVTWAPIVEGEVPAGQVPEGEWSDFNLSASVEELDNYLIKAQMQNPQHLKTHEKRAWVTAHRKNIRTTTDYLSLQAKLRADSGDEPLTEPLQWTNDVQPAKIYDVMFDNGPHPTEGWFNGNATAWYEDHKNDPDVAPVFPDLITNAEQSGYHGEGAIRQATIAHFTNLAHAAYLQSLIPVYTKKPSKTVSQGTHPIDQYTDQFGNEFVFKPKPLSQKFRADIEAAGNSLGRLFGFKSSEPRIVEIDGMYGNMAQFVPAVGDLMDVDLGTLNSVQIGDVMSEHVLDWMLDNDDSKGDNLLINPQGRIIGIDKGRTFVNFGGWDGLNQHGHINSNADTTYSHLMDDVRKGKVSKEVIDAAYLQMQKRIRLMQKVDPAKVRALVETGMANRDKGYSIPYKIDGVQVEQSFDGLMTAIEDRRERLNSDFAQLWAGIYKDAGYGDLPAVPLSALGEVHSGLQDPNFHQHLLTTNVAGKSTMLGGPDIIGGNALFWTDEYDDGSKNLSGEFFLAPGKAETLLSHMQQHAQVAKKDTSATFTKEGFESLDTYGSTMIEAAKTINHHSTDGAYNEGKITAFKKAMEDLLKDRQFWAPNLEPNETLQGGEVQAVAFPSGRVIPIQHVGQYKMMIDHYFAQGESIQQAYEKKENVSPHAEKYKPIDGITATRYLNNDGSSLTKIGNQYLYAKPGASTVVLDANDATVQDVLGGANPDWYDSTPANEVKKEGLVIVLNDRTHERDGKQANGIKVTNPQSAPMAVGSDGKEYEVRLPTGEQIFFRDNGYTNTKAGQRDRIVIRSNQQGGDSADIAASMARIESALTELGIEMRDADETDAQNTYWREYFSILMERKHAPGSPYEKAREAMVAEIKKFGAAAGWNGIADQQEHYLESVSASMTPLDEAEYWQNFYGQFFDQKKIEALISSEGYLPQYDHQRLEDPELETGKPYWNRFDIDPETLYGKGRLLGSTASQGNPINQVKSGAALGAEERLRQLGVWINGMSASSDQGHGSSHNIYTRITQPGNEDDFTIYYDPIAMLRTRTYSFDGDKYGDHDLRRAYAPSNPLGALSGFHASDNETTLPAIATMHDSVELYTFTDAAKRNEAIQHLKALGIEEIRGLPLEDRIVMKKDVSNAIAKIKKEWAARALAYKEKIGQ